MPKPNVNVVIALFESYLTIRKPDWNIEELQNGNVKLPDPASWEGKKIATCNELLQKIYRLDPNPKKISTNDWIQLAYDLYDLENKQQALFNSQWIGISHLLLDVIRAMRCYIISTLSTDDKFTKYLKDLKEVQKKHESDVLRLRQMPKGHEPNELTESEIGLASTNTQLEALKTNNDYLNDFFVDEIMAHDPKYTELKEADINAFKKNAEDGLRPGTLGLKVLNSMRMGLQTPTATTVSANTTNPAEAAPAATEAKADATPMPVEAVKTPESKTSSRTTRATKESRTALRANSKFAAPAVVKMEEMDVTKNTRPESKAGYNTRSKAGSSRSNRYN